MKLKKKAILTIGYVFALIIIIGTTSYVFASSNESNKYSEPDIRPAGLPAEAKFNPDTNEYYDSSSVEWDSMRQRYVDKEQPIVSNILAENYIDTRFEDWMNQHKYSKDPIDIALIKYRQAVEAYVSEHPEILLRSDWGVDNDGGALAILTDLGVVGLPGLLGELDVNSPFVIPLIFAIEKICKTDIGFLDTFSPEQVIDWKNAFNNKLNNAKNIVAKVVETLKNNAPVNDEEINNQLVDAGIFALPYFYNEVINNSNISLLKYTGTILPDKTLKDFNIESGSQDVGAYRQALENSTNNINIIKNLVVK